MSLESLVPPLDLCQQLKPGDFPESAMVWICNGVHDRTEKRILDRVFGECSMEFPAPTSDEIMAKLPLGTILQQDEPGVWVCIVHGGEPGIMIEKADRAATAALRLWMRVNGREVKG